MANAETRKYKHITWRETRYQSGWIVQLRGKTIGSFHSSQEAAAATLRRARGLKRMSQLEEAGTMKASTKRSMFSGVSYHRVIRKFVVNDVPGMGTYTTAHQAAWGHASELGMETPEKRKPVAQEMIRRVILLQRVYLPKHGKWKLFADLRAAFKHAKMSKAMFAAEPASEMISIQLKYGPW